MKRILSTLICLPIIPQPAVACAGQIPTEFTFLLDEMDSPITFSTTPEEALALLGEDAQSIEDAWPIGTFIAIANDTSLHFAGALPDSQPLFDELDLRYGESDKNPGGVNPDSLFSFITRSSGRTWGFGDDVCIDYWYNPENEAFAHMLSFKSISADQKLNEAINQMFSLPTK